MRRRGYMFTGKSHSVNGVASTLLGVISFVSMCIVIYLSYKIKGAMSPKLGAATFFAMLIGIGGEILGILSRREEDVFQLFPNLGITLNTISLVIVVYLLYIGIYGI